MQNTEPKKQLKIYANTGGSRFVDMVRRNLADPLRNYECVEMKAPHEPSANSIRLYLTDGDIDAAIANNVDLLVVGRYDLSINHIKAVYQRPRPASVVIGLGLARMELAVELIFRCLIDLPKFEFIEESLVANLNQAESEYLSGLVYGVNDQDIAQIMQTTLIQVKKIRGSLARRMSLSDPSRENIIRHIGERHWLLPETRLPKMKEPVTRLPD